MPCTSLAGGCELETLQTLLLREGDIGYCPWGRYTRLECSNKTSFLWNPLKIVSRLHVDYAAARDDQYEFECKQRESEREKRHITQSIKDLTRPPRSCLIKPHSFLKTGLISCEIMCDGWMNMKRQTEQ